MVAHLKRCFLIPGAAAAAAWPARERRRGIECVSGGAFYSGGKETGRFRGGGGEAAYLALRRRRSRQRDVSGAAFGLRRALNRSRQSSRFLRPLRFGAVLGTIDSNSPVEPAYRLSR